MPSTLELQLAEMRRLRAEADAIQETVHRDIRLMVGEGLVADVHDEDPAKAMSKYIQGLPLGALTSSAEVKRRVPCMRDVRHRAITARLAFSPLMVRVEEKDENGLAQFRRAEPQIASAAE